MGVDASSSVVPGSHGTRSSAGYGRSSPGDLHSGLRQVGFLCTKGWSRSIHPLGKQCADSGRPEDLTKTHIKTKSRFHLALCLPARRAYRQASGSRFRESAARVERALCETAPPAALPLLLFPDTAL